MDEEAGETDGDTGATGERFAARRRPPARRKPGGKTDDTGGGAPS